MCVHVYVIRQLLRLPRSCMRVAKGTEFRSNERRCGSPSSGVWHQELHAPAPALPPSRASCRGLHDAPQALSCDSRSVQAARRSLLACSMAQKTSLPSTPSRSLPCQAAGSAFLNGGHDSGRPSKINGFDPSFPRVPILPQRSCAVGSVGL